jgi:glycosyltransferase involved in cell wall biosynthesis
MSSYLSIGNAYLTPDILTISNTDIIHLHYPFIFGSSLAILRSRSIGVPLVITYHNDLYGKGIRRPAFWVYNRLFAPWILGQVRKIIVTSYDYANSSQFAATVFNKRRDDLVEVNNGVDVDTFKPGMESEFVRSRHGFTNRDIVVLFVSSLDRSHARKGLGFLLEALAAVSQEEVKLLIVGDGDMRPEYEQTALKLGLRERAVFAKRVSQVELPNYYAASHIVCIPSQPPEAFGLALAQGMASGKSVIGCDIPGVRSLVRPGCGFLIQPNDRAALADRIQALAGDPALRDQMGRAGREWIIQKYTWRRAGERLLDLYQEIMAVR